MRTVDSGKSSMGRLCLLGLLSLQSTLTSATTHEPSGATKPAVFNVKIAQPHSIHHFTNVDGTVNTKHFHRHRATVEAKYLNNFHIAHGANAIIPQFSNAANPLQKRDVSQDFEETLAIARKIEANFNAEIKNKGKLEKRAGAKGMSQVDCHGLEFAGGSFCLAPVSIGTPFKAFSIMLDTGSGLSWVRNVCTDDDLHCTSGRSRLSINDSRTLDKSRYNWTLKYGEKNWIRTPYIQGMSELSRAPSLATGETSGHFMRDVMKIGNLLFDQQIFGLASNVSQELNPVAMDGVLGSSFSTIASGQTPTFLENLINTNSIEQPIMSFSMHSGGDHAGQVTLGGIDQNVVSPETIKYYTVTSLGYWQISAAGLTTDGKIVPGTEMECAVDTGSSLIYVPSAVADVFFATLPGAVKSDNLGWTVPCDSLPTIKSIGFTFSDVTYDIPMSSLVLGKDGLDDRQCKLAISSGSNKDIQGKPVAIIGTVFLQNVYTVLSYSNNGKPAVGFASLVNSDHGINSAGDDPSPPNTDQPSTPSDKDAKHKGTEISIEDSDKKQPVNNTQPPPTKTPVHGASKAGGKPDPDLGGEGGGKPAPESDAKHGSPEVPETTRNARKKVEPPQAPEAGQSVPKEEDTSKPNGKGVETPKPDAKGTKQHVSGAKSTPVAKEQLDAKDLGANRGPPKRPPTPNDFHAAGETDSTKKTTAKEPAPKSKTDKDAPKKSQHTEEHKASVSDKMPEGNGTKKEHDQAAGGKDKDGKTPAPAVQQPGLDPPKVSNAPSFTISGNGSDSQPGAPGGTNKPNPELLGNGTLPPDTSQSAQESHSAAPAILSSVWSSSAVLVLVSAWYLLFGI